MENLINNPINNDKPSIGWQILAFLIPLAGLIMWFNNKNKFPVKSKRYIKLAGFGSVLGAILKLINKLM
jgi:hypothetical protein